MTLSLSNFLHVIKLINNGVRVGTQDLLYWPLLYKENFEGITGNAGRHHFFIFVLLQSCWPSTGRSQFWHCPSMLLTLCPRLAPPNPLVPAGTRPEWLVAHLARQPWSGWSPSKSKAVPVQGREGVRTTLRAPSLHPPSHSGTPTAGAVRPLNQLHQRSAPSTSHCSYSHTSQSTTLKCSCAHQCAHSGHDWSLQVAGWRASPTHQHIHSSPHPVTKSTHKTHRGNTLGASRSSDQEGLHYWAPQDTF